MATNPEQASAPNEMTPVHLIEYRCASGAYNVGIAFSNGYVFWSSRFPFNQAEAKQRIDRLAGELNLPVIIQLEGREVA
jgi:hypothetical protein